jgi:sugar lactone lactonase YvrE
MSTRNARPRLLRRVPSHALLVALSAIAVACGANAGPQATPSPATPGAPSVQPASPVAVAPSAASPSQPPASPRASTQPSPATAGSGLASWAWTAASPLGLSFPEDVVVDAGGKVFVSSNGTGQIDEYTSTGSFVGAWGQPGTAANQLNTYCVPGCPPACPPNPSGWDHCPHLPGGFVALDGHGHVAVTDLDGVHVFDENGTFRRAFGVRGTAKGQLQLPEGIAIASNGDVYVVDAALNRVDRYDRNGRFEKAWGTKGSADGQFDQPVGIAIGPDGTVYVADQNNGRIERFSPDGAFRASLNQLDGQPFAPQGLAIDRHGRVYASDPNANRVVVFGADGAFAGTIGGPGSGDGTFNAPSGVAVDSAGSVYVSDLLASKLQKFTLTSPE